MEDITEIIELQLDNEVHDNVYVHSTEITKLTTTESVEIQMTGLQLENFNTEEEMSFDDLTIPGDYSDYDI